MNGSKKAYEGFVQATQTDLLQEILEAIKCGGTTNLSEETITKLSLGIAVAIRGLNAGKGPGEVAEDVRHLITMT